MTAHELVKTPNEVPISSKPESAPNHAHIAPIPNMPATNAPAGNPVIASAPVPHSMNQNPILPSPAPSSSSGLPFLIPPAQIPGALPKPNVPAACPIPSGLPSSSPVETLAPQSVLMSPVPTPEVPGTSTPSKSRKSKSKRKPPTVTMATAATACSSGSTGGENTGRWTAEEHRLFLQGLDQHGKGWKKIASLIKSRTVVQIRTHAQKYFQKLAKARQNGEVPEGEHLLGLEGRTAGGMMLSVNHTIAGSSTSAGVMSPSSKKRKQLSGTKRKSISSVVNSAISESKLENKGAQFEAGHESPKSTISPALVPFMVPPVPILNEQTEEHEAPLTMDFTNEQLEDSLFRFLTPSIIENIPPPPLVKQAKGPGAPSLPSAATDLLGSVDPIKVPKAGVSQPVVGEISPTGVMDAAFPLIPSWYSKGADVEELLDEADALDWLADSGDLDETYGHILESNTPNEVAVVHPVNIDPVPVTGNSTPAIVIQPDVSIGMPCEPSKVFTHDSHLKRPSLFENHSTGQEPPEKRQKFSSPSEEMDTVLPSVTSTANIIATTGGGEDDQFAVFDSAFDEQAFVSALLDSGDAPPSLPAL